MNNIQERHLHPALDYLQALVDKGGTEKTVDSEHEFPVKVVLRNRGYVTLAGRGLAADWSITATGRDFLKTEKKRIADEQKKADQQKKADTAPVAEAA